MPTRTATADIGCLPGIAVDLLRDRYLQKTDLDGNDFEWMLDRAIENPELALASAAVIMEPVYEVGNDEPVDFIATRPQPPLRLELR